MKQPRCFPLQSVRFVSLFCRHGFKEQGPPVVPAGTETAWPPIHHTHARQATSAHSVHGSRPGSTAIQVSTLRRTQVVYRKGSPPMHKRRSPRKQGRSLHAIGDRPKSASAGSPRFPPSTHPKLGVRSRHQGFHSYALKRIFRPFFRDGRSD